MANPNEKVNQEENVEGQVDLLRRVLRPRTARFHLELGTETLGETSYERIELLPE